MQIQLKIKEYNIGQALKFDKALAGHVNIKGTLPYLEETWCVTENPKRYKKNTWRTIDINSQIDLTLKVLPLPLRSHETPFAKCSLHFRTRLLNFVRSTNTICTSIYYNWKGVQTPVLYMIPATAVKHVRDSQIRTKKVFAIPCFYLQYTTV